VGRTEGVLTPFSVEFARTSNGRCGAPTLVPVETGGCPVRAVIFEVSVSQDEAASIVYRREIDAVGSGKLYREPAPDRKNAVRIDHIAGLAGFDLVLSTRIASNIFPLSPDMLADLAINSARKLSDGRDGITYLIDALQCGIVTPLSRAYEASILEKTGTPDLASALSAIEDERSP
jgi:hypothetical protein